MIPISFLQRHILASKINFLAKIVNLKFPFSSTLSLGQSGIETARHTFISNAARLKGRATLLSRRAGVCFARDKR